MQSCSFLEHCITQASGPLTRMCGGALKNWFKMQRRRPGCKTELSLLIIQESCITSSVVERARSVRNTDPHGKWLRLFPGAVLRQLPVPSYYFQQQVDLCHRPLGTQLGREGCSVPGMLAQTQFLLTLWRYPCSIMRLASCCTNSSWRCSASLSSSSSALWRSSSSCSWRRRSVSWALWEHRLLERNPEQAHASQRSHTGTSRQCFTGVSTASVQCAAADPDCPSGQAQSRGACLSQTDLS